MIPERLGSTQRLAPLEENMKSTVGAKADGGRRHFVGGSDARIIMGEDETALIRLWNEKR